MKAVIDTNILISGIFWKGPPSMILAAWAAKRFSLVVSTEILDQYEAVIDRLEKKNPTVTAGREVLRAISIHAAVVTSTKLQAQVCTDPDDDKFLAAALAGKADYVVTGDVALLKTDGYQGVKVIKPTSFLRLL